MITDTSTPQEIAQSVAELYELVVHLYLEYIDNLERFVDTIPDSETAILNDFAIHAQDVQAALEHDLGIFEKAVAKDKEDLQKMREELKIKSLYSMLQGK